MGKVEKWLEAKLEPIPVDTREPLYSRDPDEPHPLLVGLTTIGLATVFLMVVGWLLADQIEVALAFWGVR